MRRGWRGRQLFVSPRNQTRQTGRNIYFGLRGGAGLTLPAAEGERSQLVLLAEVLGYRIGGARSNSARTTIGSQLHPELNGFVLMGQGWSVSLGLGTATGQGRSSHRPIKHPA